MCLHVWETAKRPAELKQSEGMGKKEMSSHEYWSGKIVYRVKWCLLRHGDNFCPKTDRNFFSVNTWLLISILRCLSLNSWFSPSLRSAFPQIFLISIDHTSFPDAQAKTLGLPLTPFFSSNATYKPSANLLEYSSKYILNITTVHRSNCYQPGLL